MGLVEFKLVAAAAIFLSGLAGGLTSFRLERSEQAETLFSFGSALAGGVFLGAGLIHMLPDAAAGFGRLKPGLDYPLAFFTASLGFVLILLLDRVIVLPSEAETGASGRRGGGPLTAYVLALTLSLHSILAGAALGAEDTLLGSVVILIAIIGHKGSAAFALAVGLRRAAIGRRRLIKILVLFSLMTPLGIAGGTWLNALLAGQDNDLFEAVFDALAAGTFLYIATLDIIEEEFASPRGRRAKFALLCLGVGVMALLALRL